VANVKPFLDESVFKAVIDNAPLISIDLVVRNASGEVLLGQRLNRPAKGFWFVPGGRILKNESLSAAFRRLTLNELGVEMDIVTARYLGLYEHFYADCVFTKDSSAEKISTHYVVNGFEVILPDENVSLPNIQHDTYKWFTESELLNSEKVHDHSKWYFDKDKGFL